MIDGAVFAHNYIIIDDDTIQPVGEHGLPGKPGGRERDMGSERRKMSGINPLDPVEIVPGPHIVMRDDVFPHIPVFVPVIALNYTPNAGYKSSIMNRHFSA